MSKNRKNTKIIAMAMLMGLFVFGSSAGCSNSKSAGRSFSHETVGHKRIK